MDPDIYCWKNGANGAMVARQPITNLRNLRLDASAGSTGNDTVTMFVGGTTATTANMGTPGSTLSRFHLRNNWKGAEFIVVGDCCGSQATFNSGARIVVRTTIRSGTRSAPTCVLEGFTGETNNLNLVGTAAVAPGASPAVVSNQSVSPGSMASCSAASGIGDTHLRTFGGLFYDFQAAGDFTLAEAPDFVVQGQQVSGAPRWPNASVNRAVATRMGKTQVAVCLPNRLEVDGEPTEVGSGSPLRLADGVDILRTGNSYLIRGQRGESVRAQVNDGYIDVSVGLGRRPLRVRGLLANANGNVDQVATSGGAVLRWPISFKNLYYRYGDSWRIGPGASLLCKGKSEHRNPTSAFYSRNLPSKIARHARAVCIRARVRKDPLLGACTLDVAVIGKASAARVYLHIPAPVLVGFPR